MVDVVPENLVALRRTMVVAPAPAYRHAGIVEIGHFVVGDRAVACMEEGHALTSGQHAAAGTENVVVDRYALCEQPFISRESGNADLDGADAEVVEIGTLNAAVAAVFAEPDSIGAGVGDFAIDEADVIVFVADGKKGVSKDDRFVAKMLYKTKKPVILAVNKIDKPDANPERILTEMAENNITPEAWGGNVPFVNISCKFRIRLAKINGIFRKSHICI